MAYEYMRIYVENHDMNQSASMQQNNNIGTTHKLTQREAPTISPFDQFRMFVSAAVVHRKRGVQQKVYIGAFAAFLFVILCILVSWSGSDDDGKQQQQSSSFNATTTDQQSSMVRVGNQNQNDELPLDVTTTSKLFANMNNEPLPDDPSQEKCHHVASIQKQTSGKPIWMPGYPGSGYWIIEKMIPKVTGLDATAVYYHHTCVDTDNGENRGATVVCITHWPFINRDSPEEVEATTSPNSYHSESLFVLRNPAHAIPSYYTRWYGNQQHVHRNHVQPPLAEWIQWRDAKFSMHLDFWKGAIVQWHDGIAKTSTDGIGMYVPYELLIDPTQGPMLMKSISEYIDQSTEHTTLVSKTLQDKNNVQITDDDFQCIWNEIVEPGKHAKDYDFEFTAEQKLLLIQVMDELIAKYDRDEVLKNLLSYYRHDIETNLNVGY